jgi:glycosyltransferase involved in cell wall biosynthesis
MEIDDILTVCLITYNHDQYVEQAIDSILMQKTDFNWKLVIADDCSKDNTREILKGYQQKYPEKIYLILQEKNVGPAQNFIDLVTFPNSKYIAYLEGDDYWMDENKLQKQVGFLEENPNYVIHSSGAQLIKNGLLTDETIGFEEKAKSFVLSDFFRHNNLVSCTIMYRNILASFPDFYKELVFGDWFLYILLMKKTEGKAYRLNENFSAYRIHNASAMSSLSNETFFKKHLVQVIEIKKYLKLKTYNKEIVHSINFYALQLYKLTLRENLIKSFKVFLVNFYHCRFNTPFKQYLTALK